jgi:hypothetical protein
MIREVIDACASIETTAECWARPLATRSWKSPNAPSSAFSDTRVATRAASARVEDQRAIVASVMGEPTIDPSAQNHPLWPSRSPKLIAILAVLKTSSSSCACRSRDRRSLLATT